MEAHTDYANRINYCQLKIDESEDNRSDPKPWINELEKSKNLSELRLAEAIESFEALCKVIQD